tara:strand:+ start:46 stop:387 length:342 start_codon:yes stop_codon:yes gene_type:complete
MKLSNFEIGIGLLSGQHGDKVNQGIISDGVRPDGSEFVFLTMIDDVLYGSGQRSSTHFNISLDKNPNWSVTTDGFYFNSPGVNVMSAPLSPIEHENNRALISMLVIRKAVNGA